MECRQFQFASLFGLPRGSSGARPSVDASLVVRTPDFQATRNKLTAAGLNCLKCQWILSLPGNGRDGFHSVPDLANGNANGNADAVERVPTGEFLGPMQPPAATPTLLTSIVTVLSFALLLSLGVAAVQGGETNGLAARPRTNPIPPASSPQNVAAEHERAGRKREAAVLYEAMVRTNPAARKVLSHRLVTIYSEIGETRKALAWARQVMRDNPDPPAYLAAVHGRLGQWKEARDILEREIAGNTNVTRAVSLRWQLAEVLDKEGDQVKAKKILNEAADAAKGTAMEPAARRRLQALKEPAK